MQKNDLCGARIKKVHDELGKKANALQEAGATTAALIINLSRQGFIYIPALFVLKTAMDASGLAWAQPVADLLSTILVAFLYVRTVRRMEANAKS
jgi:Na+-driven multidrug efflux pump